MKVNCNEFYVRYFQWARLEFNRQIELGYPDLETFTSGIAWKIRKYMTTLSNDQQCALSSIMLCRSHSVASALLGIQPTAEAVQLDALCDSFVRMRAAAMDHHNVAGRSQINCVSKRSIRRAITNRFMAAHGTCCERIEVEDGQAGVEFELPCEGYFIRTWFDFGPRERSFEYGHGIRKVSARENVSWNPPIDGGGNVSLLSWLGISSQTFWPNVTEDDIDVICDTAVNLCSRFFAAAPRLLETS